MITRLINRTLALLFFWRPLKIGRAVLRDNRASAQNAPNLPIGFALQSLAYWRVPVVAEGRRIWLLLTPAEFMTASKRALLQPEDSNPPEGIVEQALWPID